MAGQKRDDTRKLVRELVFGIKLYIEEAKEDRKEAEKDRKQAAEDRKQAAEDRKQAAEDRKRADEDRKRADDERKRFNEWFRRYLRRTDIERKLSEKRFERMGNLIIEQLKDIKQILISRNGPPAQDRT